MKEIFFIQDNLENKITYYHLLAFLIMLPFDMFYSEVILISLFVHTLIHVKKIKLSSLGVSFLVLSSIYLLTIVCSIYSLDSAQAFKDIGKQLAILLFPFIFSAVSLKLQDYKLRLLKAFAFTCVFTCLYLYIDAFRIIQYNALPFSSILNSSFTHHNFSSPIELHAVYFSMYISLSLVILIYFFVKTQNISSRIFYALCIFVLFLSLAQLTSRAVIIATLLIINFILPFFLLRKEIRMKFCACSLILTAFAIVTITKVDAFKNRMITELKQDLKKPENGFQTFESRASRWKIALKLIEQKPFIGYGSGSEGKILKEKYYQNRMYVSYLNELNAHNEYLSILLKHGSIGLLIYLYLLATAFVNSVRKKDVFFTSFLIIITIVCLSENILDTNKGIFFFSFFISFFAFPISKFELLKLSFVSKKRIYAENKIIRKQNQLQEEEYSSIEKS